MRLNALMSALVGLALAWSARFAEADTIAC